MQSHLVHHFLEANAAQLPGKIALIHGDTRVSYGELNHSANRMAHWLLAQGAQPGDRVAILLENSLHYVVCYYGSLKAGLTAVPLSPELRSESLGPLLRRIAPRVVVASTKVERVLQDLDLSRCGVRQVLLQKPSLSWRNGKLEVIGLDQITLHGSCENPFCDIEANALASIVFTSGSTGAPKGVMLSHGNIVANTRSITEYLHLGPLDIQMVVLPFFYVMGKSLLNTHIAVGGTVVINNTFAYPATVLQQMENEQVTGFSGVPSTYAYLLHRSPLKAFRDRLGSLRYCSQAGGHMARQTKEELLEALPLHTELYVMYGATEAAARLTYVEPAHLRDKIDSIGIPIPGVTMKVVDESGTELAQGQVGELVAQGANIMRGYWNDPEGSAAALGPHGYRTGDLGYRDEDGYFHIMGRRDSQLKVAGHRVNPQEIEDALIATGLVIEAAVLGIEDALSGTRLAALVVPKERGTSEQEILRACLALLPRHKLPGELALVGSLRRTVNGKVDRAGCLDALKASTSGATGR